MHIAILTQPLFTNYGGIMQAYAVQKILKDRGHDVETIDIKIIAPQNKESVLKQLRTFVSTVLYFILGKSKVSNIQWPFNNYYKNYAEIGKTMMPFIRKIIDMSPRLSSKQEFLDYVSTNKYDAYVVGSDQVWRPMYSPNIGWFFLDFLSSKSSAKRISISASFGTDKWEFTEEQTRNFKCLAQRFDAISVRESSGVKLCRKHFDVDATLLIDPTMMLTPLDYANLVNIDKVNTISVKGKIFSYLLDSSIFKKQVLLDLHTKTKKPIFLLNNRGNFGPYASVKNALKNGPKPVAQWLRCFQEADFIVTDSFHGTIFSILFHRQFIVVANETRGISRIENLLMSFGLEDRLIDNIATMSKDLVLKSPDWDAIDKKLSQERTKFYDFLRNNGL